MKSVVIIAIAVVVLFVLIPTTSLAFGESIPKWVKNIFVWYGENEIEEDELLKALQYLIESKIIVTSDSKQIVSDDIASIFAYTIKDEGDFYFTLEENPNAIYPLSAKEWFEVTGYLEDQMQFLNSNFKLPYDVEVIAKECNVKNAWYDPQTKQIIMCYEFVEGIYGDFLAYYEQEGVAISGNEFFLGDTVDWVFYHEVGHALTIIYQLPYTGLAENVADQFASYIVLSETDFEGDEANWMQDMMYNVGTWFLIQGNTGKENIYWDVHSLDFQRFYNTSCYAYGHNPEYSSGLITDGWLPQKRADNCLYEYSVLENSWTRLLANPV